MRGNDAAGSALIILRADFWRSDLTIAGRRLTMAEQGDQNDDRNRDAKQEKQYRTHNEPPVD